jgi:hypothetical protein
LDHISRSCEHLNAPQMLVPAFDEVPSNVDLLGTLADSSSSFQATALRGRTRVSENRRPETI